MKIQSVFDKSFAPYGKVIKGFDTAALEAEMLKMPCPDGAVVYVPSVAELEALDIMKDFTEQLYGGMPIQIGYCNGDNHVMNCLEYHRDSELNLAVTDLILLLYTSATYETADVIGTYVYRVGIQGGKFSQTAAIGLFATAVNFALVAITNTISNKLSGTGLW